MEPLQVVNIWDARNYSFKMTVPTYEMVEAICIIQSDSSLSTCLGSKKSQIGKSKSNGSPRVHFLTVGERGVVRIWSSEGYNGHFESIWFFFSWFLKVLIALFYYSTVQFAYLSSNLLM